MKLLKLRRPLLLIGVIAIGLVCLAAGVVIYFAAQYYNQLADYKSGITQKITAANNQLKTVSTKNDSAQTIQIISALQTALARNSAPPQWFIESQADRTWQAHALDNIRDFNANLQTARDMLMYSQSVNAVLVTLPTGDAANLQQCAAGWQQAVNELNAIKPPAAFAAAHQQLVAAIDRVGGVLAVLPELYTAKDYDGFASKKSELATTITAVHDMAATYKNLAIAQDALLGASYQKLAVTIR